MRQVTSKCQVLTFPVLLWHFPWSSNRPPARRPCSLASTTENSLPVEKPSLFWSPPHPCSFVQVPAHSRWLMNIYWINWRLSNNVETTQTSLLVFQSPGYKRCWRRERPGRLGGQAFAFDLAKEANGRVLFMQQVFTECTCARGLFGVRSAF